ncbi:MAG: UDP-N-acetylmuramate dehydrogenase [Alphaproteobacteria bacterium]|nr:UDP-N-acetylmuramate dehydrogenase [Alphaproteobacteria bacterium]
MISSSQTLTDIEKLPPVRGKLLKNAPLSDLTWFRVGGAAEILFKPEDEQDLIHFLNYKPKNLPITVIGATSNLLIRDGGINGVVIKLGKNFAQMIYEENTIIVGAACLDVSVSRFALDHSLAGLEFLSGIPGTIGGGLRMNAGAYGKEFSDIVSKAKAIDLNGHIHHLTLSDMGFKYRHCSIDKSFIFLNAQLKGYEDTSINIAQRMQEIQEKRIGTQPIRARTGGSTFANPDPNLSHGKKAWQLIDEAGCRGLRKGDAMVSEMHCNFLINNGAATAADIEELGEEVRQRVFDKSGIMLRWEIQILGNKIL